MSDRTPSQGLPKASQAWISWMTVERGLLDSTVTAYRREACSLNVTVPAPEQIVVRGKGAKERIVLLTARARHALDELGGRVAYKPRTVQRHFQKAGTHPHAWRHTLACDLAASGADLGEVQEILGHSNPGTTKVYMAYQTDRLWGAHRRRMEVAASA